MNNIITVSPLSKLSVSYGFAPTVTDSYCLVAFTDEGICFLAFADENNKSVALEELKQCWKNADFQEDTKGAKLLIDQIFSLKSKEYNLLVHGSDFQIKVWKALMDTRYGTTISYEEMGKRVGGKNYTRAAASAIAKNDISYLIPCHRIVSKTGKAHKYRWGGGVKAKLIKWEREKNN
jgi:AraC family transcriptional regulator of adaptative response/methylated-DNA-[protein]-cysteine methyltransferase